MISILWQKIQERGLNQDSFRFILSCPRHLEGENEINVDVHIWLWIAIIHSKNYYYWKESIGII